MAIQTISTLVSTTQTIVSADTALITATGGVVLDASVAISLNSATLLNFGTVFSAGIAVELNGRFHEIVNHGTMTGGGTLGVIDGFAGETESTVLQLTNFGTITTAGPFDTSGVLVRDGGNHIENHGTITAVLDSAIEITSLNAGGASGGNVVENTGTLRGNGNAIELFGEDNDLVQNSGVIFGDIRIQGGGSDRIINSGTIHGSILLNASEFATITNSGLILGDILAGGAGDLIRLVGGQVTGTVQGRAGSDLYIIDDADVVIVEVLGEGDNDAINSFVDYVLPDNVETLRLQGGALTGGGNALANQITGTNLANHLEGAEGNDVLAGRNGADTIEGDEGDDILNGELGHDVLFGGTGRDTLSGGSGNDRLDGGDGNDRIVGVAGEDTVTGGLGADVLFGGAGADAFIYRSAADSGTTATTRYRIEDFVRGSDLIDLGAIDANVNNAQDSAFNVVGALNGTAGQLTLRSSGGDGFLEGDTNGDGVADFSIQLTGVTSILATDLIL